MAATDAVLGEPSEYLFAGNPWTLKVNQAWINERLAELPVGRPGFVFTNVGETHQLNCHESAPLACLLIPCEPFGGELFCAAEATCRQLPCLSWVDPQPVFLMYRFDNSTVLVCVDHGDCWVEDGPWALGVRPQPSRHSHGSSAASGAWHVRQRKTACSG